MFLRTCTSKILREDISCSRHWHSHRLHYQIYRQVGSVESTGIRQHRRAGLTFSSQDLKSRHVVCMVLADTFQRPVHFPRIFSSRYILAVSGRPYLGKSTCSGLFSGCLNVSSSTMHITCQNFTPRLERASFDNHVSETGTKTMMGTNEVRLGVLYSRK